MTRAFRIPRRTTALILALGLATVGIGGCNSAQPTGSTPPSANAVVAALSSPQPAAASGGSSGSAAGTTQSNSGGSVTIQVTWENPKDTTGPLTFSVGMDTHSVDLDGVDLSKLAVLRNDRGQEVKPQRWDAPSGGHHRSGTLAFPAKDGSGNPIVGAGTKTIEMVIRDVAGVNERVLRWQVAG